MNTVTFNELTYQIPHGIEEIKAVYGEPGEDECTSGTVKPNLTVPGLSKTGTFHCHEKAAPVFQAFFDQITERGLAGHIVSFGGCYNNRTKRGGAGRKSTHAWGIAIDLNAKENPFGVQPPEKTTPAKLTVFTPDHPVVMLAVEMGMKWGGSFKDGMHFQLCTGC